MSTVVDQLWTAGYPLGPAPESLCGHCRHPWGHHLVTAPTNRPLQGGTVHCPQCPCTTSWDIVEDIA